MAEDGVPRRGVRAVERCGFARSMCGDLHLGQERVCIWVKFFEDRRDIKTVDEKRRATRAVRMCEKMEELESTWVGLGKSVGRWKRVPNSHSR